MDVALVVDHFVELREKAFVDGNPEAGPVGQRQNPGGDIVTDQRKNLSLSMRAKPRKWFNTCTITGQESTRDC